MDNYKEKIDLGHYWDLKGYWFIIPEKPHRGEVIKYSFILSFIFCSFFFPICRDRKFLMRLEQDFLNFIQDPA